MAPGNVIPAVGTDGLAARREHRIDDAPYRALRQATSAARTSVFGMVHAALTNVLSRGLGAGTISLGTPVTKHTGADRRGGCLTNVIPLVAEPWAGEPARDYLARLRRDMLDSFDHSEISLGDLRSAQAQAQATRAGTEAPLTHAMLIELHEPGADVGLFRTEEVFTGIAKSPLAFLFEDTGDALRLICEYTTAAEPTGAPLTARIDELLGACVEEISTLSASARKHITESETFDVY